jgi:hypothetical protein
MWKNWFITTPPCLETNSRILPITLTNQTEVKQRSNRGQTEVKQRSNRDQTEIKQRSNRGQTEVKRRSNRGQTEVKQRSNRGSTLIYCTFATPWIINASSYNQLQRFFAMALVITVRKVSKHVYGIDCLTRWVASSSVAELGAEAVRGPNSFWWLWTWCSTQESFFFNKKLLNFCFYPSTYPAISIITKSENLLNIRSVSLSPKNGRRTLATTYTNVLTIQILCK